MHHLYFPPCPVDGPIHPPVPYGHIVLRGAIPMKCGGCQHSFEGGCTRFHAEVQRYMHLDYGPCGIHGPTDPVYFEDRFMIAKVEVPRKCSRCRFLIHDSIYGFTCRKDEETWGDFRRGLDWGHWRPDRIYLQLPHPKLTTRVLVDCAWQDDLRGFIIEHRRINPGIPMTDARADFARLREIMNGPHDSGESPVPEVT